MKKAENLTQIGWREWVALPQLGIDQIKAKVDTGARTSSLHAFKIEIVRAQGKKIVHFKIHPYQKDNKKTISAKAVLDEVRYVTNSGGQQELRPVIITQIKVQEKIWDIEVTLTNRSTMGFRMLLGRQTMKSHFIIDPARSFLLGKPVDKKARKKSKPRKSPKSSQSDKKKQ